MLTLKRKTAYQKFYLMKLKTYTNNFLTNYKKRYSLFPWSKVLQVSKMQLKSNTPIVVAGHKYSVKEMVAKISKIKLELREKQRISYYNYIFNGFKKASDGKLSIETKDIYLQSKEELDKIFLSMKEDLKFCLNGLREINKSLKAETIKTESEECIMLHPNVENLFNEFTNELMDEVKDTVITAYEYLSDNEEIFDILEDEITEGANIDMSKEIIKLFKSVKTPIQSAKKDIKNGNYAEARKKLKEARGYVKNADEKVKEIHSDEWSVVFGAIIRSLIITANLLVTMVPSFMIGRAGGKAANKLMSTGIDAFKNYDKAKKIMKATNIGMIASDVVLGIPATLKALKDFASDLTGLGQEIKEQKEFNADSINVYRHAIRRNIKKVDNFISKIEKMIDKKEEKEKELATKERKKEKLAKESTHFNEERLKIYQACESGEINEEEREILLEELRNEMALTESTIELEASEEPLSKREKYDRIKSILYEKCGNGEISEEEREDMIRKAYDKIFEAGNENSSAKIQAGKNMAAAKEANEQQKVFNKEASNTEKEINDQAGSIIKDTKI